MILSLVNVKGGVGKTTTAVNLAGAFADGGLRILLVDLDPQGSAGFSLGVTPGEASPSSAEVLLGEVPVEEALWESPVRGVDVLPGSPGLVGSDLSLARKQEPERLLAKALAPVRCRYDFILVDCPPGLSILTLNGLAASRAYIAPVVPHDLDLEALGRLFEGLERSRGSLGRRPLLLGILLTMVDRRTRVTEELVAKIRRRYGGDVFRTEIPINVRLAVAPRSGQSIFEFERWSTGGLAYSRLGAEVLRRARRLGLL